jgi:Syntaxin
MLCGWPESDQQEDAAPNKITREHIGFRREALSMVDVCKWLVAAPLQGCGQGSSSERARSAVTGALRRKLAALMADFQQLRSRIQDEYRSGRCWQVSRCRIQNESRKLTPQCSIAQLR